MKSWVPGTPIKDLPGKLPPDNIAQNVELEPFPSRAFTALSALDSNMLTEWALWLDMVAKTGKVRTSSEHIVKVWSSTPQLQDIQVQPATVVRLVGASWVTVDYTFKIRHGRLVGNGSGIVVFTPEQGKWKVWMITTVLENYEGHGNPDQPPGENLGSNGPHEPAISRPLAPHYHVIIVGGGQGGLALAARSQALGIDYVVLEKSHMPGHRWVSRYDAVRQHTIRELNNLPYGSTWDAEEEEFLPGPRVAFGFRRFVEKWRINLRTNAEVTSCTHDGQWKVTVHGQVLTAEHVAFALGVGLTSPRRPTWPGEEQFTGTLMHMVDFKNSKRWKGQRGVVVGSGTAGHDIAQDMFDNGLEVTMVQRNKTAVYPMEWYAGTQRGMYRVGVPNEAPDRIAFAMPTKISGEIQRRSYDDYVAQHPQYFEALERAGFCLGLGDGADRIPNEIVLNHFGGYYIDIGTSKHIADGDIKVVNGVIDRFTEGGLIVRGKKVPADVVVLATGYEPDYRKDLESILGPMARRLPMFWGLSKEGDIRSYVEESAPGLWLVGGAAAHARFYTRFMALQIQEQMLRKDSKI